jgi:hypothetical protein
VQAQGWTAVSLNYRLAPAAAWPAQLNDAGAALALLRSRAGELGIDVDRIGAIGDSAGGHLAALLGEPAPGAPGPAVGRHLVGRQRPRRPDAAALGGRVRGGCRLHLPRAGLKVVDDLMGCTPARCP